MRKLPKNTKINHQGGAAMLISVVFFLFIALAIISGLVSPSVREFRNANDYLKSRQSLFLSESGVEDAYLRLKNAESVGASISVTLNGHTATTTITDSGFNQKTVSSLGDVDFRQRKSELVLNTGTGISFNYGIQTGAGGLTMANNSVINGSVYSNGPVVGSGSITGSAFSANSAEPGGATGLIDGITIGIGSTGNAYAHTVTDSTVAGVIYCQTGSQNNKSCDTSLSDPGQIAMPVSEQNILDWKAEAETGGIYSGNYTLDDASVSLGPKKIMGNLSVTNNADFTVTGTLWVTGNIIISNNATIRLSPNFGSSEGVIVADGTVNIGNNSVFSGSGSADSYLMVLSTSTSATAMTLSNNGGAVILYAANGTVNLQNNAEAKSLNGKHINMGNNSVIVYDSGLANANFVNGPSGGWNIASWKETE